MYRSVLGQEEKKTFQVFRKEEENLKISFHTFCYHNFFPPASQSPHKPLFPMAKFYIMIQTISPSPMRLQLFISYADNGFLKKYTYGSTSIPILVNC